MNFEIINFAGFYYVRYKEPDIFGYKYLDKKVQFEYWTRKDYIQKYCKMTKYELIKLLKLYGIEVK